MTPSERAALKGLLAELDPEVAIEIGRGDGGSLRRLAAQARHVHSFDLTAPAPGAVATSNVTFHTGDSHDLLPRLLDQLTTRSVNVDLVLVDGDHSAEGVRRDVEDLLLSPAISHTLVLVHDTANPEVRAGLNAIDYTNWPKLTWVDLDWLPGYVSREDPTQGQAWAGLGLLVADTTGDPGADPARIAAYAHPVTDLLNENVAARRQVEMLRQRVSELEELNFALASSISWRLTRPLRTLKNTLSRSGTSHGLESDSSDQW